MNEFTPSEDQPGNEDREAAAPTPPASSEPSWRPADHYASPPTSKRLPRWVPLSCGGAAIIALVLMFGVGMFLQEGGLSIVVELAIGEFQTEVKQMLTDDVASADRDALDASLQAVLKRLGDGDIAQQDVLPVLREIQQVSRDRKVTPDEVKALLSVVEASGVRMQADPPPDAGTLPAEGPAAKGKPADTDE